MACGDAKHKWCKSCRPEVAQLVSQRVSEGLLRAYAEGFRRDLPEEVRSRIGKTLRKASAERLRRRIEEWRRGERQPRKVVGAYRDELLSEADGKCSECGWSRAHPLTGTSLLQIDHINGDSTDNRYANLRVLCPNCHALTETFMFYGKSHQRLGVAQ